MYLVIRDATGGTLDGVVLAIGTDRMRVALRGSSDTIELRRAYTQWFNDGGDRIELDALLSDGHAAAPYADT